MTILNSKSIEDLREFKRIFRNNEQREIIKFLLIADNVIAIKREFAKNNEILI